MIFISKDGKFLFAKKHPEKGGSYPDAWHIIGGGQDEGETLRETAVREALEETGLVIEEDRLKPVGEAGYGESEKLQGGERVIAEMEFNRFEYRLDQDAADVGLPDSTDEFAEFRWVDAAGLLEVKQIPGVGSFWVDNGYVAG